MKKILLAFTLTLSYMQLAHADNFIEQSSFDGNIRAYDFNTDFGKSGVPSRNGFSLGGAFNVLTGSIGITGLQAGATLYTAQPMGVNSSNPQHVDNTVPGREVNVLGQTFLQYRKENFLVRAGNQIIDTPWLNAADSRMIPATYQGLYTNYHINKALSLSALRTIAFKGRDEDTFSQTNLYNSHNIGDESIPGFTNTTDNGALAFGSVYKTDQLHAQAWYYKFYDFANLLYGDGQYSFSANTLKPYLGTQLLREWGDGQNYLAPYAGGSANSNAGGLIIGTKIDTFDFSVAYNNILKNSGSFREGGIISPYTAGYHSDPLYTTSMLLGLVEKNSGQAAKLSAGYMSAEKNWDVKASYAEYYTAPYSHNTKETDLDVSYHFDGHFKGFSARNRIGLANGDPSTGRVLNDRIMLQYNF